VSLRKIVLGTAAMSSVGVLRLLAQFLIIPVLSRLLSPTDYGVVAMAMPFVFFTMMFADAGVGRSLVRTPSGERGVWSTCFWLSVFLGVALALIVAGIAPVAAIVFHEPCLSPIIMALTFVVFAQAISTIPGAALQQNHRFKVIAGIEMSALLTGVITAIVIALCGGGAWALVGQQIALYAVRLVLTFWFSPFHPLMVFDLKIVGEHLIFGRDVIGVNIVTFFSRSIDNLIIGKVLATAAVGIYSMAFQFARLPMMLVIGPLQYVLYAQLAQIKNNHAAIGRTFLILTRILAIFIFPVMGMVAVAHQPVFKLLLSEKWSASGELFMIVAPAYALQALTGLSGTIMMVVGRTDIQLKSTMEFTVLWIATLLISVWFGLEWAAISYDCIVLIYSPRLLMLVLPLIECSLLSYFRTLMIPAMATLVCISVFWQLQQSVLLGEWVQLLSAAAFAIIGIAASALAQRRLLTSEYTQLKAGGAF